MNQVEQYIYETLGQDVHVLPIHKADMRVMPFYIADGYQLAEVILFNRSIILAEVKEESGMTTGQMEKQTELMRSAFERPVILLKQDISAIERKRLIQKGVNFIVPGK